MVVMKPNGYLALINNCSDSISSLSELSSANEPGSRETDRDRDRDKEDSTKSHETKVKKSGLFGHKTKDSSVKACFCCDCNTSLRSGSGISGGVTSNPIVSRVLKKSIGQATQTSLRSKSDNCLHKLVKTPCSATGLPTTTSFHSKTSHDFKFDRTDSTIIDDEVFRDTDSKLDSSSKVASLTQRVISKVAALVAPSQNSSSQSSSLSDSSSPKLICKIGIKKTASLEQQTDDRIEKALAREQARRTRSLERNHRHLVTLDSGCRDSTDLSVRYQPDPTFKPKGQVSTLANGAQPQRAPVSIQKFSMDANLIPQNRPRNIYKAQSPQQKPNSSVHSSIISKPTRGWLHPDHSVAREGINYNVRYIGCMEVKTSMKQLDFKTRSEIAKECINIVCQSSGLKISERKYQQRSGKQISQLIGSHIHKELADTNVHLTVTSRWIKLSSLDSGQSLFVHDMPNISFASGGDPDMIDYVAYVAKCNNFRGCYVLECPGGSSHDVITTIGQAFELRFKEFLKQTPLSKALHPQVVTSPTNPTVAKPDSERKSRFHRDSVGSNLIDLNTEIPTTSKHDYVNESIPIDQTDVVHQDPFDINTSEGQTIEDEKSKSSTIHSNLIKEIWFHGSISRSDAEILVKEDGDFLVRESIGTPGQYVLTGIQNNSKKHLLLVDGEGIVRTKDRTFDSVNHLINHHKDNCIPILSSDSPLRLLTPIRTLTLTSTSTTK